MPWSIGATCGSLPPRALVPGREDFFLSHFIPSYPGREDSIFLYRVLPHLISSHLPASHLHVSCLGSEDSFLITTGLRRFLRRAFETYSDWRRPLFVTHVTRDDLLLAFIAQ